MDAGTGCGAGAGAGGCRSASDSAGALYGYPAYDDDSERRRRLSQGSDSRVYSYGSGRAASADLTQRRMQEIVDEELAHERSRQFEDLSKKVAALEEDKRRAAQELEATETQYIRLVEDARAQLAQVQAEHAGMQHDISLLRARLEEATRRREASELRELSFSDRTSKLEAEVQRLDDMRRNQERLLQRGQSEVAELRWRLQDLQSERSSRLGESDAEWRSAKDLRDAVATTKRQLEESERQSALLRERYLAAGQNFEESIGRTERESQLAAADLQAEIRHDEAKLDKHRQRVEASETELQGLEATAKANQTLLEDKEREHSQLQQMLENERALCKQRESRYIQAQQAFHQAGIETRQLGEMIPVTVHQRVLEEQAGHFRDRMRELDLRLRAELDINASLPPSPLTPPVPSHAGFATYSGQEATRQAEARAMTLETEIQDFRRRQATADAELHRCEEQRLALASSVSEANSHLSRLQRIVDDEEHSVQTTEAAAREAAKEVVEAQDRLAARTEALRAMRAEASASENLGAALDEQVRQIAVMEDAHERQRRECHLQEMELSELQGEHQTFLVQVRAAERRLSRLEEQSAQDVVKQVHRSEINSQLKYMLRRHVAQSRTQVQQLRQDVQFEMRQLQERCQSQVQEFIQILNAQHQHRRSEEMAAVGEAERHGQRLEQNFRAALEERAYMERELAQRKAESAWHAERQAQLEAATHMCMRHAERLVAATVAAAPGSGGLDRARSQLLSNEGLCSTHFADGLAGLRQELAALFEVTRAEGAATGREEAETRYEAEASDEATASEHKELQAAAGLAEVQARCRELELEVENQRSEISRKGEAVHDRMAAISVETASVEATLEAVSGKLRWEQEERERLDRELHTLEFSASVSLDASRVEAAAPLRRRLYELVAEVELLQARFTHELQAVERDWSAKAAESVEVHRKEAVELRRRICSEVEALEEDVAAARQSESSAMESVELRATELCDRIKRQHFEADERRTCVYRFEGEAEAAAAEEQRSEGLLHAAERRLTEAQRARHAELEEHARRRGSLLRRQEQELGSLRRAKEQRVSSLRCILQQSISGLSAVAHIDESFEALINMTPERRRSDGGELGRAESFERLAARARKQLALSPS